jgi:hypothetical protein
LNTWDIRSLIRVRSSPDSTNPPSHGGFLHFRGEHMPAGRKAVVDHEHVRRLRAAGKSIDVIACLLHCGRTTVRRILNPNAAPAPKPPKPDQDDPETYREQIIAQDRKFCAALQAAIDAGLERAPCPPLERPRAPSRLRPRNGSRHPSAQRCRVCIRITRSSTARRRFVAAPLCGLLALTGESLLEAKTWTENSGSAITWPGTRRPEA